MLPHRWIPWLVVLVTASAVMGQARDSLTLGATLEPPHLDPTAGAAGAIDEVVYANVFEGLTRITSRGGVAPGLARRWSVSADQLTYTFELRPDVKFHDGTPCDSSDVVYSLRRARAPESTNAQKEIFEAMARIEARGPQSVVITLGEPSGLFLFQLGWGDAVIVAPESADSNRSHPVGTGPFRFRRWVRGDRVELVRNEDYWGKPVALRSATIRFISDPAAAAAALLAGDVDAFANFGAPELLARLEADPRLVVVTGTTEGETILATNHARKPFSDLRVRRAMAHAVDRGDLIRGALFGYATAIGSHFSPHHPAYVDLTRRYPFDLPRARSLLAQAGYEDGFAATLILPPPSYARRSGEIVAAQLAKIGIRLELVPVEWARWLDQVFEQKNYDLTIVAHTEPFDIEIYARDDYYFNYKRPEFKTLMQTLARNGDEAARNRLLEQAQRMLSEDAVNGFLFQLPKNGVWNKDLQGLWHNSPLQANDLTGVFWRE